MHELGVARNLIDVALSAMSERGVTQRATALRVEVGRFTAVVPDALRFYVEILARDTLLEGAELTIETIPLRTRCRSCALENEPDPPSLMCPNCDGLVEIVTGRELRLVHVDVPEEAA
jgi:hydrogenase nickel incorporation protein HypA/HybF